LSKPLFKYSLYALVALAAAGAGVWVNVSRQSEAPADAPAVKQADASEALFALGLPDLSNQPQSLKQWRGKVLVVNFWATWCAPCREEIPMFVKMQERYAAKGLQFVGISIDQVDKTAEFARNFKINYPTLIGTFDTVELSRKAGNVRRALPYTVVVDRKGQIVATELGGLTVEKLEALITPLF
jgi:thiol-disulfide isomerase/thioredoxin